MLHLSQARHHARLTEPTVTTAAGLAGLGLRRVEQVRVTVGHGAPVAVVTGIAHRYPRQFRVSMATAARLAAEGVPIRIDDTRGDTRGDTRDDTAAGR